MAAAQCPACEIVLTHDESKGSRCPGCDSSLADLETSFRRGADSPISIARLHDRTPLASRTARLGAVLVDLLCACLVCVPGMIIAYGPWAENNPEGRQMGHLCGLLAGISLFVLQLLLLSLHGQTIGKMIARVRVVHADDETMIGGVTVLLRELVFPLLGALCLVGMVLRIVDILWIFGKDRRCCHDYLAGTKVIVD